MIITSDQTGTERVMHRVLHVVQFLRVMTLFSLLAVAGLAAAWLGGLHTLPMFDTAAGELDRLQADSAGEVPVAAVFVFAIALGLAFVVWLYLATVLAWRRSLKLIAILYALCGAGLVPAEVMRLAGVWGVLHPGFIALAMGLTLLMTWVAFDMAAALWKLSAAPPRPGYVEAFGLRLSRRPSDRINRYFDLPRTPWRNGRNAAAYALSLAGLLLFAVSLAQLFLGNGIDAKLKEFEAWCDPAQAGRLQDCHARSRQFALQTLAWTLAAIVGLKAGLALHAAARKLSALQAAQALQASQTRFVLYLRPFPVDALALPKPALPALSGFFALRPLPVLLEEELFDVCDGHAPLIAVGTPGNSELRGAVAYREYLDPARWQAHVAQRMRDAEAIVMVLSTTPGVLWELGQVLQQDAWRRTLFLLDPAAREPAAWDALMARVLPPLQAAGLWPSQGRFEGRPLGFYFAAGGLVEVRNDHWSTTSYRIAFAQFLAAHAAQRPR